MSLISPNAILLALLLTTSLSGRTYSTAFPATENPICEGSPCNWAVPGSLASQWGNVQTLSGFATGVSEPTTYGDPTAIVTGTWGPDQTVQATVHVSTVPSSCCHEVELRLRATITSNNINGYEILCPVWKNPNYGVQIVRWNGANGQYVYLPATGNTGVHQCVNGDVIKATITGGSPAATNPVTINVYLNGASMPFESAVDHGTETGPGGVAGPWTSGNPGIGFYDDADSNWSAFGLTSFTATDGSSASAPPPPSGLHGVVH